MLSQLRSKSLFLLAFLVFAAFACDDDGGGTAQQGTADAGATADATGGADDQGIPPGDAVVDDDAAAPAADLGPADPDAAVDDPDAAPLPPQPWPVDAPGFFRVGYTTESITYQPPFGEPRTIRVAFWYPTLDATGTPPRYSNILLRREAFLDATPALEQPAPVLMFSHGNMGLAEQNYTMAEFFASHGWVFVAVEHTGNTALDGGYPQYLLFEIRPLDVRAALDHLDALPDDHPLSGGLTAQRAMSGHSFGGYTTLAVGGAGFDVDAIEAQCAPGGPGAEDFCAYLADAADRYRAGFGDARLQALVPLTPAGAAVFGDGLAEIEDPVLLMTGARDATLPNAREGDPIWAAIDQPDSVRLDFPQGGHFTFSDACFLAGAVGRDDGCGDDFVDVATALRLINGYTLAFVRYHVLGDEGDGALLYGDESLGPEAERSLKPE